MPDQHTVPLAAYLQAHEFDEHIDVREVDSVRPDWWEAYCQFHDWLSHGSSRSNIESVAAEHIHEKHRACSAPSDRTFMGVPLYCDQRPGHDGDEHSSGGYTWPKTPEELEMSQREETVRTQHAEQWQPSETDIRTIALEHAVNMFKGLKPIGQIGGDTLINDTIKAAGIFADFIRGDR